MSSSQHLLSLERSQNNQQDGESDRNTLILEKCSRPPNSGKSDSKLPRVTVKTENVQRDVYRVSCSKIKRIVLLNVSKTITF